MHRIIVTVLLFISVKTFCQDTSHVASLDSINARIKRYDDSVERAMINMQTQRSVDYFVQLQKERKAKEKKQAIIRIVIGIGFLIILFIGFRRRRAKK